MHVHVCMRMRADCKQVRCFSSLELLLALSNLPAQLRALQVNDLVLLMLWLRWHLHLAFLGYSSTACRVAITFPPLKTKS